MSYRSHNQRDANQPEIVAALRERGAYVVEIERPVDLLVGYQGRWVLAEVKVGPKARIRPSQVKFHQRCREAGLPFHFIFGLEDVDYWFPSKDSGGDQPAPGRSAESRQDNDPVGR